MLHPETVFEASHIVADVMHDIWQKRSFLKEHAYFVFRVDASNFDMDDYVTVFVHFLIDTQGWSDRWYAMVADEHRGVTYEKMTEDLEDEVAFSQRRCESVFHYAFSDLVRCFIEEALNEKCAAAGIEKIDQITIWDLFPAEKIRKG